MEIKQGWLTGVKHVPSPNYDNRPEGEIPSLLIIHNISLPPGQFGGPYIDQLFTNTLAVDDHPFFNEIAHLRVSAHCLIRRDGEIVQYVPFTARAWHAGVSFYKGREKCNDFSIGIELEGTDECDFTPLQYQQLSTLTQQLIEHYPGIKENITGHSDVAPGRKTDPGPHFNWSYYRALLAK
ncbi:TPA: 1,6-anhydro-N-acetylmuramyl-L-alanine amidase AmpD [Proteus mirabilis]|nr:1,6-anhydro-N-acetylmuramyl-L-alanine amidase AmpD [Proteus mirabilis]MBA7796370.1 1,6-anhydro-N-acetylmuramyl-L-alanine amidase AmpD [Citrobacter sp. RHBSTW-01065]NBM82467.1 1,6-anhydro-N-acetylmuramyl-L-alanine amidase AmpD [Proteus sp. G4404]NBN00085.1 1,6-anhydro-N-acetylmuramyl-L-alanine amidase AmpD [Proteus sp. G4465]NBN08569.1 1,6-anhydro-N-acetylmuramyl-L-alanine amidase AmpD [Proteus sp. G4463]NBN14215.1 1,6-anhydro-N-acetylmuramyl-L-alanine amidase AmpD [Proteus sp. G4398]NBN182